MKLYFIKADVGYGENLDLLVRQTSPYDALSDWRKYFEISAVDMRELNEPSVFEINETAVGPLAWHGVNCQEVSS